MLYFRTLGGDLQFQINRGTLSSYGVQSNDHFWFNYKIK